MGNIKGINIKNRTYYFFDDLINIKKFDSNLPKIEKKKSYKDIGVHYIGYHNERFYFEKINRINPYY